MKKYELFKTSIGLAVAALVIWAGTMAFENVWARFMDFTTPHYYERVEKKWEKKSTNFLIRKLGSIYDGVAVSILRQKPDFPKEPTLVKIIESRWGFNKDRRASALAVLFAWNEKKATDLSLQILREGRKNPLYGSALLQLSHRRYEPAFPFVVELAQAPDRYENGSVYYLEQFGKPEAIPILKKMLEDTNISNFDQQDIARAIKSIQQKNGIMPQVK